MSDSYLDGKVREALVAAKGSRSIAQNILMVWAMKDPRLLQIMAQPFLKAITGAAIVAAIKRGVNVPGMSGPPPKAAPKLSQSDLAQILSQLGNQGNQGNQNREERGRENETPALRAADIIGKGKAAATPAKSAKPAAPADQATALRTLAAVYARNRKRP